MKSNLEKYPKELEHLDYICGVDEAGRGSLAGPVFVGAVIFPKDFENDLIRDSKKLSEKRRIEAFDIIRKNALAWTYCHVSEDIIDKINIQNATYSAMFYSIKNLEIEPEHILVDGNSFKSELKIPHTCVVKGDNKYLPIAAASIVAKVVRDEYMCNIDKFYPKYMWKNNKGYGSKEHIEKIVKEGPTHHHRKSFLNKILS